MAAGRKGGIVDSNPQAIPNLRKLIAEVGAKSVLVGVRETPGWGGAGGPTDDGEGDIGIAGIAAVNEFGTEDGLIPERSFLRATLDEDAKRINAAAGKALGLVLDGRLTADRAYDQIGFFVVGRVQRKIVDFHDPGNAPSTIARKGEDNPLIDTGRLRQSIDHVVDEYDGGD